MTVEFEAVLNRHLGTQVSDLRRLAGGASHATWAFDIGDRQLVVRREVDSGLLASDMRGEFDLIAALHAQGLPVPEPVLCVTDEARAFMVIGRVDGTDLRKALAGGVERTDLGRRAVQLQAQVHATEVGGLRGDGPAGEVHHWTAVIEQAKAPVDAVLAAALAWLSQHLPDAAELTLVHADFKANNLLVGPGGGLAVLDWELAHRGDPVEDLAWTMLWTTRDDLVGGLLSAADYLAYYAAVTGRHIDPERLRFWQLLAVVKLWSIFLTGLRADTVSPTLLLMGRSTVWLQARALDLLRVR